MRLLATGRFHRRLCNSDSWQYPNVGLAHLENSCDGHDAEEEDVDDSQDEAVVQVSA